jgi:hypothetical protein
MTYAIRKWEVISDWTRTFTIQFDTHNILVFIAERYALYYYPPSFHHSHSLSPRPFPYRHLSVTLIGSVHNCPLAICLSVLSTYSAGRFELLSSTPLPHSGIVEGHCGHTHILLPGLDTWFWAVWGFVSVLLWEMCNVYVVGLDMLLWCFFYVAIK